MLFRSYYGMTEDEKGNPTQGRAEVIIAKHRNGSLSDVPLRFIGQFAKFADLDYMETNSQFYGNSGNALEPQSDFLSQGSASITMPSKNWDNQSMPENKDIARGNDKNDIEDILPY